MKSREEIIVEKASISEIRSFECELDIPDSEYADETEKNTNKEKTTLYIKYALAEVYIEGRYFYGIIVSTRKGDIRRRESEFEIVGSDRDGAEHIFDAVSKNRVLPCTLFDVLCDMRSASFIC